jgi:outer membrane protein assembly factor BamB
VAAVDQGEPRVTPLRVGFAALAGAVACWAVMFHALGWSALHYEADGGCGGDYSPCPQGLAPVLLLAFGFSFAGVLGIAAAWSGLPFNWAVYATVGGLLAGIVPGWGLYQWLRGAHLETVWTAPPDRPANVRGMGNWAHGGLVVRVRTDRLTAYAAGDGRVAWTVDAPDRAAVCTMSRTTQDGVGLVAWALEGEPCATVAAVDLRDGRVLWQRNHATLIGPYSYASDQLTVAAGVAVLVERSGIRAVGLRENDERWQVPTQEGCRPEVAGAPDQVTALTVCPERGAQLIALDPATGRQRWQAGLPVEPPLAGVEVLRANPVVVHAVESGTRGADVVVSYDDNGRQLARIARSGPDYDLVFASPDALTTTIAWPARPVDRVAVAADVLVAAATAPGDDATRWLVGTSLTSGQKLWRTPLDEDVVTIQAVDGGFAAFTGRLRLHSLSPTGRIVTSKPLRGGALATDVDVCVAGGTYVVLAPNDFSKLPPARGVR